MRATTRLVTAVLSASQVLAAVAEWPSSNTSCITSGASTLAGLSSIASSLNASSAASIMVSPGSSLIASVSSSDIAGSLSSSGISSIASAKGSGSSSTVSANGSNSSSTASASGVTYTNPILSTGADPWVIQPGDGYYYMTYTTSTDVTLLRSAILTDWNNADSKQLWLPPTGEPYSTDVWAPEIHFIDGLWYVIFTADPNGDNPPPQTSMYCTFDCPAVNHRMYTLVSSSSDIWASTYTLATELNTYDQFAIDGTYFQLNSQLYHVYSCWYSAYVSWPANLCITAMSNPTTVSSNITERAIISVPTEPWEQTPYGRAVTGNVRLSSNEGPEQLTSPITGQQFIIYSAARSDNPNYCLGLLALKMYDGADPQNPEDWVKSDGCVFYQNKLEGAYSVGHASFVKSPDGSEWFREYPE